MAKEKEGYREILEQLNEVFPDKQCLRWGDIEKFFGISNATATKRFRTIYDNSYGVTKAMLAKSIVERSKI